MPIHSFHASKIDFGFTLFFLVLLALMIAKKMRPSYIVYSFLIITLPLATCSTMSMIRYLALSFPHFIVLGKFGAKYKFVHIVVLIISTLFLSILSLRFINWHWAG